MAVFLDTFLVAMDGVGVSPFSDTPFWRAAFGFNQNLVIEIGVVVETPTRPLDSGGGHPPFEPVRYLTVKVMYGGRLYQRKARISKFEHKIFSAIRSINIKRPRLTVSEPRSSATVLQKIKLKVTRRDAKAK